MPNHVRLQHGGGAVATTLGAPMTSGATALLLAASTGWPDGSVGPFYAVIDPGLPNEEKVIAISRTTLTLNTLTRGADGTSASAHASGAVVAHVYSADEADESNALVNSFYTLLGAKGSELVASAANVPSELVVGSDGTVRVADSTASSGQKWVTPKQAVGPAVHWGTFSDTLDSLGTLTVTHGAPFTPTAVIVQHGLPTVVNQCFLICPTSLITSTTFRLQYVPVVGSVNTLAVAGSYVCLA